MNRTNYTFVASPVSIDREDLRFSLNEQDNQIMRATFGITEPSGCLSIESVLLRICAVFGHSGTAAWNLITGCRERETYFDMNTIDNWMMCNSLEENHYVKFVCRRTYVLYVKSLLWKPVNNQYKCEKLYWFNVKD